MPEQFCGMYASRTVASHVRTVRLSEVDVDSLTELPTQYTPTPGLAPDEVMFRLWPQGRPWRSHQVIMSRAREERAKEVLGGSSVEAFLLNPRISAVFRPQAWQADYAVEVDGKQSFDALPALLKMSFVDVCNMLRGGRDFDELANRLPARQEHPGPFEVDLPFAAAIPVAVKLLTGRAVAHADLAFVAGMGLDELIDEPLWDDFRAVAAEVSASRNVLREASQAQQVAEPNGPQALQAQIQQLQAQLQRAQGMVSILYGALNDASLVVDASQDEEYAYQAELEAAREFLGVDTDPRPAERLRSAP